MPGSIESSLRMVLDRRTGRLKQELERAERESARAIRERAVALSSGGVTLQELAAMGHPYARRHAEPLLPAYIINRQSGRFAGGWKDEAPAWEGDTLTTVVRNDSPEARWMVGTSRMVPRPILEAVVKAEGPKRRERLIAAMKRGLK